MIMDYDNDGSDNCDYNFGTFDDFGVKNDQKVSHNMILMSKYKGQHGGKKGKKNRARHSPPLFGQCPKENVFYKRCSLILMYLSYTIARIYRVRNVFRFANCKLVPVDHAKINTSYFSIFTLE